MLVGETLCLLPWWRGGVGRRGLSLSYLSLCKLCLRWLSLCPVLVIVNVWHFCQCKEQSLKRQNNSCYSDPNFPEADSLSRHAVCATLWCFFFLFYFISIFYFATKECKKCMCTFVYVQNECVDICVCISTHTVMV